LAPIFQYEPHLDSTRQIFRRKRKSLPEVSDIDDEGSNNQSTTLDRSKLVVDWMITISCSHGLINILNPTAIAIAWRSFEWRNTTQFALNALP
jgi:hypothetical protein